jgi:carbon-monoxide dehydrogenase small subunit
MLKLQINGEIRECDGEPDSLLIDVIRNDLGLTGAKKACESGECGACTVLINGNPVNSCLVMVSQLSQDDVITTIEGIAKEEDVIFQSLSHSFVEEGAVQCGFCTPGTILSAYSLLKRIDNPSSREIEEAIAGNLCRCTGYVSIVKAISRAARERQEVKR